MENHEELLMRAVEQVVPRKLAEQKLQSGQPLRVYLGIDPTGAKLHLGHSVPLRKLRAFQQAGHQVIFVIGSFTAMVGDPSGQEKQREQLTREQVLENFKTYKEQAALILDFENIEVAYNHEWHEKLSFIDVLNLASNFTIQQMLEREMFQQRMKDSKPISVHEFLYPLMQGYDSVMLDVDCELGGSDQLFNMLCGRTLQKVFGKRDKFVLTTKLIEGTDGRKMSKTYGNCIYIEDSPNEMYGKVMSLCDELITTYMECCTEIPMEEVRKVVKAMAKGENPKSLKMRLAREIVTLYHSAEAAQKAEEEFQRVFTEKGLPETVPEAKVEKGSSLLDLMVRENLAPSKAEARRLIEQGGVKLNDTAISSLETKAGEGILRVGKRKFLKIVLK